MNGCSPSWVNMLGFRSLGLKVYGLRFFRSSTGSVESLRVQGLGLMGISWGSGLRLYLASGSRVYDPKNRHSFAL